MPSKRALDTPLEHRNAPASALEVGCNVGGNLRWVAESLGERSTAGVDVNESAIATLRDRLPGVVARVATGRDLPFADANFASPSPIRPGTM